MALSTAALPAKDASRARALAARIQVPAELPPNHQGEPLASLSASSILRFDRCPDDWRRHYLLGQRYPKSGSMFLGSRVDEALGSYYQARLDGSELEVREVLEDYRKRFREALGEEEEGVEFEDGGDAHSLLTLGDAALTLTFKELVPVLGRPTAVQRRFELRLAPHARWSVIGYVDLDTIRTQRVWVSELGEQISVHEATDPAPEVWIPVSEATATLRSRYGQDEHDGRIPVPVTELSASVHEREVPGIVDYKVKGKPLSKRDADSDTQAGLYLAERAFHGVPVVDFRFAQVIKPSPRGRLRTGLQPTVRVPAEMRATLLRAAQVATQIRALYDTLGPERPWGFAEPGHWKCRYCGHAPSCPAAAGI